METNVHEVAERLESAATLLERTLAWFDERQSALSGQVEKISAMVEQTRREEELAQKLGEAEREIAELKAAAVQGAGEQRRNPEEQSCADPLRAGAAPRPAAAANPLAVAASPVRRTMPAAATEMLAKHGIGEGPIDVRVLDAALAALSLEQRIAVKSQLMRTGTLS
jgi:hypothetical protein